MTRTVDTIADSQVMSEGELAHLGEGTVAYLRKMSSDDLRGRFPAWRRSRPDLSCGHCSPRTASRSCWRTNATAHLPERWKTT